MKNELKANGFCYKCLSIGYTCSGLHIITHGLVPGCVIYCGLHESKSSGREQHKLTVSIRLTGILAPGECDYYITKKTL